MDVPRTERSIGELFGELSQQTAELIRHETRLAKAELSGKVAALGRHAATLGASVLVALSAVVALTAAVMFLLVEAGLAPWLSALITAVAMALVAWGLAQAGLSALKKQSLAPVETIESVKETTQWIKNETR